MTDPLPPSDASPQRERLVHLPVDELKLAPNAPNPQAAPPAFTDSVKTYGILQPLLVRPGGEGYEVVAGFKRLQAAREAGLKEVPVRVYRVEDAALAGLYTASNVQGDRRRRVSVPSEGEYRPTGKLSGLLEEELNRPPTQAPYKAIVGGAAVILLCLWAGIALTRHFRDRPPDRSPPPEPGRVESDRSVIAPTPVEDAGTETRSSVAYWRRILAEVEGVKVRDEQGVPKIVFEEPVFSRIVTVDPRQKPRLAAVSQAVFQAVPGAVLVVIGHTDNDPIRPNSTYRSNDYLGELRAQKVRDVLTGELGVSASRVRAVSGDVNHPPFPNDNPADKARNRTVTMEIMVPRSR